MPVNAERRGQHWRVTCGPAREAMFRQVHQEGDLAASDFTETSSLRVTIAGQRFERCVSFRAHVPELGNGDAVCVGVL